MCVAGAGPGGWQSGAGLGGLCSADNCHALYCTHPQSLPGPTLFRAFLPLQPGSGSHLPGQVASKEVPGGQGPGRAWTPPPEASSQPEPCSPRSGGVPCRIWLNSNPLPPWSHSFPSPSPAGVAARTNCVWGRHILAGSPWRLLPQGCSNHPRSPRSALASPRLPWGPISLAPPRGEPKVLLYITAGDLSIFIAVLKPHMFYTKNHPLQPPSLSHPNNRVSKPLWFLGQAGTGSRAVCRLQQ